MGVFWRRALWLVWLMWLGMIGAAQAAPAREYKLGPAPAWVLPQPALGPAPATPFATQGSVAYLLQDTQTRIEARSKVAYIHSASKALDGEGVQKLANLSINFDPSYQTLTLHAVRVLRGGQVIDKLAGASVHVLQRETELEYLIYDGSKTASLLLTDVRIGDVVEYAYSLEGLNPVFGNRVAGGAALEWGVPIEHVFSRLLAPRERALKITPHNTRLQPLISEADGYRDYRWEQRFVPALKVEKDAPGWFDPYAHVQWSEFADWAAVVQWALPLYQPPSRLGPALQQERDRIARAHADAAARIAAVLRLVQREVRYLGIEVGPGSHAPRAPDLVFERRFGDCKDKVLLTVTLLRALGVEAAPALVNTDLRRGVGEVGATPNVFNHVIVRVRHGGRSYWFDPTRAEQQGDLEHLAQANFGLALVLAPQQTGLTDMNQPERQRRRVVEAVLDASAGLAQPVSYQVSTTLEGSAADRMRAELARNRSSLAEQYLRYYGRDYPGIRATRELEARDNPQANQLTILESYEIPTFWVAAQRKGRREATIHMPEVEARLKTPDEVGRRAPLALDDDEAVSEQVVVKLPERWDLQNQSSRVDDPAFEYTHTSQVAADGRQLTLRASYLPRRDHVEPGDMGHYAAKVKEANNDVEYLLYYHDGAPGAFRPGQGMRALTLGQWLFVAYALLLTVAGGLAFQVQAGVAQHKRISWRLLGIGAAAVAGLIPLVVFALHGGMPMRGPVVLAAAVLLASARYLMRLLPAVPDSHPAYALARVLRHETRRPLTGVALSLLKVVPPLVGWVTILGYVVGKFN